MNDQNSKFIEQLNNLAKKAHVPYSHFRVVAYFENNDGSFFSGINIENVAYPNSMCAERVGLVSAINNNLSLNNLKIIHIYSPDSKDYLSPCGGCRQSLSEHINDNVEIRMYKNNGEYISKKFNELFPLSIKPENIKGEN